MAIKKQLALIDTNGYLAINKQLVYLVLMILGAFWIGYMYKAVLSSLVLGALLAYLLIPVAEFLSDKFHLRARLSGWVIFLSFLLLLIMITRLTVPAILSQLNILTRDFDILFREIIKLQPFLNQYLDPAIQLDEIIPELENEINQIINPTSLFRIIRSATDNIIWLMVTLMTCFYLLMDHKRLVEWIYKITPLELRDDLEILNQKISLVWRTYLRGQFVMMVLIGVVSGIGGFAVGLRNALIIGVIAGILEIIPSLGPTISTIIAGVAAWTHGSQFLNISNFWFTVLVCGIFILIQAVENTILLPRVMSKHMNLHPALVFIAVVTTFALFGVIATLIVLPLLATTGVIIQYIYQKMNIAVMGEFDG